MARRETSKRPLTNIQEKEELDRVMLAINSSKREQDSLYKTINNLNNTIKQINQDIKQLQDSKIYYEMTADENKIKFENGLKEIEEVQKEITNLRSITESKKQKLSQIESTIIEEQNKNNKLENDFTNKKDSFQKQLNSLEILIKSKISQEQKIISDLKKEQETLENKNKEFLEDNDILETTISKKEKELDSILGEIENNKDILLKIKEQVEGILEDKKDLSDKINLLIAERTKLLEEIFSLKQEAEKIKVSALEVLKKKARIEALAGKVVDLYNDVGVKVTI
jgi:chromosome segregation ATPase